MRPVTTRALEAMLFTHTDLPTMRTGLTRVVRIDKHHFHTFLNGLVDDHLLQFPEGPPMQTGTDSKVGFDTVTNMHQVFKNNQLLTFRFVDDLTAHDMVDMCHMASFPAGSLPKMLFGTS